MEINNRPPIKLGAFFILFSLLSGCTAINSLFESEQQYKINKFKKSDYTDQVNYQGELFLEHNKSKVLRVNGDSRKYFRKLVSKLEATNDKFLKENSNSFKLILLKDRTPYYLTLPNGKMILSTGLFEKYIDNENLLSVILSKLIYISRNKVYYKRISIPRGKISLIEIMKLVDVPLPVKVEINKWSYHMMFRAGFDGLAVLNWIQIQNKNILDFSMMYKDLNLISKEEYSFKTFIVENENRTLLKREKNSSKEFYTFKKDLLKNATSISIRRASVKRALR